MKLLIAASAMAVLTIVGAILAIGMTQNQNANNVAVVDFSAPKDINAVPQVPGVKQEPAVKEDLRAKEVPVAKENPLPVGEVLPPPPGGGDRNPLFLFDLKFNTLEFTGKREDAARALVLSMDKGATKVIMIQVVPLELKKPAIFRVDIQRNPASVLIPGVDVTFVPSEFTVTPGQTTTFKIVIHARNDAPDGAKMFYSQITSDAFSGSVAIQPFELRVGNAAPIPVFNPPVERPPP